MKKTLLFSLLTVFLLPFSSFAGDQGDMQKATNLTRDMFGDFANRKKQMESSGDNQQAVYELAATIFGSIVVQSKGDPEVMRGMIEEGFSNPEEFAKKWSPAQYQKLQQSSTPAAAPAATAAPGATPNPGAPSESEPARARLIRH